MKTLILSALLLALIARAEAAAPQIASVATTAFGTPATSHVADMPSGVSAGDLLIFIAASRGNVTVTSPAGLTWDDIIASKAMRVANPTGSYAVWARISEGDEGSTQTFTTSSSFEASAMVLRITGFSGTIATDIDVSAAVEAGGSTPNPDSVTAGWGSDDNLFIALAVGADDDQAVNTYPYADNNNFIEATGGANVNAHISLCSDEIAAASDDPAAFDWSNTEDYDARTIVIRPAAVGGSVVPVIHQQAGLTPAANDDEFLLTANAR